MSDTRERLATEMRRGRRLKSLSQSELADRVGASLEAISNIERSKSSPSVDLFAKIVQVLDLDPRAIVCSPVPDLRSEERRDLEDEVTMLLHRLDDKTLKAWLGIGEIVAGVVLTRADPH